LLQRIERLEKNLSVLERIHTEKTIDDIAEHTEVQWAIRYGLMESIQIVIDIACHMCGKFNLGSPLNYGDCVRKISKAGYITQDLEKKLLSVIGLRNLLIHEYTIIESARLFSFLAELDPFRRYIASVKRYAVD